MSKHERSEKRNEVRPIHDKLNFLCSLEGLQYESTVFFWPALVWCVCVHAVSCLFGWRSTSQRASQGKGKMNRLLTWCLELLSPSPTLQILSIEVTESWKGLKMLEMLEKMRADIAMLLKAAASCIEMFFFFQPKPASKFTLHPPHA